MAKKTLFFDVGVRNLAYCVCHTEKINDKFVVQPYVLDKTDILSEIPNFETLDTRKLESYILFDCMIQTLTRLWNDIFMLHNIETIVIEDQPGFNPTQAKPVHSVKMKGLSAVMYTFFRINTPTIAVVFQSSRKKQKIMTDFGLLPLEDLVPDTIADTTADTNVDNSLEENDDVVTDKRKVVNDDDDDDKPKKKKKRTSISKYDYRKNKNNSIIAMQHMFDTGTGMIAANRKRANASTNTRPRKSATGKPTQWEFINSCEKQITEHHKLDDLADAFFGAIAFNFSIL